MGKKRFLMGKFGKNAGENGNISWLAALHKK
jgi:hypothetical protein